MSLYLKRKDFFKFKLVIEDENGVEKYHIIKRKGLFNPNYDIFDTNENLLATVNSFRKTIQIGNGQAIKLKYRFSLSGLKRDILPLGWQLKSSFWYNNFAVTDEEKNPIIQMKRTVFSFKDEYKIDFLDPKNEICSIAMALFSLIEVEYIAMMTSIVSLVSLVILLKYIG